MLSRFHLIPERHGRTDRQTDGPTDRIAISISRISVLTRDKNWWMCVRDPVKLNTFFETQCISVSRTISETFSVK